jgi:predicted AlkP superfamily phosphohydrolase/phosphomutase
MSLVVSKEDISDSMINKKILFIGLDGASKRIIDSMIERKELPFIGRLINTGSYFHAPHNFEPCASPVIWTSISSGKKPEKHGVKGFFDNSYSLKASRIWEIFDSLGLPVGVMGHMLTWPPKKVQEGFIIPSILALGNECYPEKYKFLWELTHDSENEKRIRPQRMLKYLGDCYRNGIQLSTFLELALGTIKKRVPFLENLDRFSFISSISMRIKLYRDLFIHLCRKFNPKYAYFHIHYIDTYSHHYWQYMEPELFDNISGSEVRQFSQKVHNAYRNADRLIKKVVHASGPDTLVVIASDHGFKGKEKSEYWYERFTLKARALADLDTQGDIYISIIVPTISVRVRNATRKKNDYYKSFFHSIEIVEDKKPFFVIEEVEPGDFLLKFNSEIDHISGKHVSANGKRLPAENFLMTVQEYTAGIHDEDDGVLILNGPGVRQGGYKEKKAHVYDIIPTLLALCNMPIGKDMDGEVITEGIEEGFLEKYPLRFIDSYENLDKRDEREESKKDFSDEEAKNLREQLKNLGYF